MTAGFPLTSPAARRSSTESCTVATSGEPHGRAGAVAHDDGRVLRRVVELVVRLDLPGLIPVRELPLGPVHVGLAEHAPDVLQADPVFVQGGRVELDPHRRKGSAAHEDLTDALHLGELLHHDARRRVVHLAVVSVSD